MNTKGIGTEYRRKMAKVITSERGIITPALVSEILHVSRQEAGRILSRWCHQCWVKRIKKGVYIPIAANDTAGNFAIEDSWVLANSLYAPGYIAGFSAIKHWDFSEQLFETTTFFTTKKVKDRQPIIGDTRFQLKTITNHKNFGTKNVWREEIKIPVSDPSKTIVDILDDPSIVGGMRIVQDVFLEYKKSRYFDLDKLVEYGERMRNKTIFKRFGFLMEALNLEDVVTKYDLANKISSGYSSFDPGIKNAKIIRRWNLKVPEVWIKNND